MKREFVMGYGTRDKEKKIHEWRTDFDIDKILTQQLAEFRRHIYSLECIWCVWENMWIAPVTVFLLPLLVPDAPPLPLESSPFLALPCPTGLLPDFSGNPTAESAIATPTTRISHAWSPRSSPSLPTDGGIAATLPLLIYAHHHRIGFDQHISSPPPPTLPIWLSSATDLPASTTRPTSHPEPPSKLRTTGGALP